jgi:geranylgeranyl diphosphate synthase type II
MQKDYTELLDNFENYISAHKLERRPASLYEPVMYINALGGKRIRAVLLLMAYNMWHEDLSPAMESALAIEYFHNFTLMHDDIMDEAQIRRGQPSVHERYGRNAAILSGDAMLIKAFDFLLDADEKNNLDTSLTRVLSRTALEICEGQQMDMDFEKQHEVSVTDYLEMIRKKTACLLGASLQIGAALAGAKEETNSALYHCGEDLGIAFQIQDDVLDIYGAKGQTGKRVAGDILQGKKNFLYVHALNALPHSKKDPFIDIYNNAKNDAGIESVMQIYDSLDVKGHATAKQDQYYQQAMMHLDKVSEVDTGKLRSFALKLIERDH